jgi:hypothetical protein
MSTPTRAKRLSRGTAVVSSDARVHRTAGSGQGAAARRRDRGPRGGSGFVQRRPARCLRIALERRAGLRCAAQGGACETCRTAGGGRKLPWGAQATRRRPALVRWTLRGQTRIELRPVPQTLSRPAADSAARRCRTFLWRSRKSLRNASAACMANSITLARLVRPDLRVSSVIRSPTTSRSDLEQNVGTDNDEQEREEWQIDPRYPAKPQQQRQNTEP